MYGRMKLKVYKISSTAISRTRGKVSEMIKQIYDYETGTSIIATVTGTITRQGNLIQTITYSRDIDMEGV
jgi:hypothetical protein